MIEKPACLQRFARAAEHRETLGWSAFRSSRCAAARRWHPPAESA